MISSLNQTTVKVRAVAGMGLDPEAIDIDSPEAIAAAIRRAASFLCPTTARELIGQVVASLEWLVDDQTALRSEVTSMLDALVGYGDLLELAVTAGMERSGAELYLGPPGFIVRRHGGVMLFGIAAEGQTLVPHEIDSRVDCERHVRFIPPPVEVGLVDTLLDCGLWRFKIEEWLSSPRRDAAAQLVARYDARLAASIEPGPVEGLRILDPARPSSFYMGRWRVPTASDSGRYVARRPRQYGAAGWCYVELRQGVPRRLIDLPISSVLVRACDEAWRLQAAIDATHGHPQTVRYTRGAGIAVMQLESPPPSWLQRRLDILGTPVHQPGALVSYRLPERDLSEELAFAQEMLWVAVEA